MFLNRSFFKDDVDKMTTSTGDASRELHQPSASTVRNDSKWTDWSNSWDWRESSWQDVWWWWKLKDFDELWKNSMGKKTNEFGFEKNQMHLDLLKLWVLWDEKCWFCFLYIFISFYIAYFFWVLEKPPRFESLQTRDGLERSRIRESAGVKTGIGSGKTLDERTNGSRVDE